MLKIYAQEAICTICTIGKKNSEIAAILGRDTSTIGREIRRNQHLKLKQYLPDIAERKTRKVMIFRPRDLTARAKAAATIRKTFFKHAEYSTDFSWSWQGS